MGPSSTFISYSKVDAAFALQLAHRLRSEGIGIWIDQLDIAPGARWDRAIEAAMASADRLLVILSPTATASENVQDEIGLALDTGKPIIPVLCKPCDVPMRLRRLQHIDFTQDDGRAFERLLAAVRLPVAAVPDGAAARAASTAAAAPAPGLAAASAPVAVSQGRRASRRNIGIGVGAVLSAAAIGAAVKLSGFGAGVQPQCGQEGALHSVDGDAQTLEIRNNLANPVSLYWITHAGELRKTATIQPKQSLRQDTFEGHYWVIKDVQDQCLRVVKAPAKVTLP